MTTLRSVCVFCGSRPGLSPRFADEARALGLGIAERGWRLVYGAGDVGLMGEVARAAKMAGAATMGVIPTHLMGKEQAKRDSDAIVVLPGGAGSLDEFFEVLTWRQIGLHKKPIFLLDTDGYWQPLIQLVNHVIASGFADASLRDSFVVVPEVPDLIVQVSAVLD